MAWLEITINTEAGKIEDVAQALTGCGFSDLVIEDQQEFEEFLDENRAYWDYIDENLQRQLQGLSRIKLYLEEDDRAGMERLSAFAESASLELAVSRLEQTDWEESWKDSYPPQEVGENLVVLPYWLAQSYSGGRNAVILDPGLTFGTGAHPSTQMVMEVMERRVKPGASCLDLGSGSGILSITALRLGAKEAVGVDIDPKAEGIARENAAYNGFGEDVFTAMTGNVTEDHELMARLAGRSWDVVLVNIVADVILGLAPILPNFLGENTVLICSGILDSRLQEVLQGLARVGIRAEEIREKEDWRCIAGRRMI